MGLARRLEAWPPGGLAAIESMVLRGWKPLMGVGGVEDRGENVDAPNPADAPLTGDGVADDNVDDRPNVK